MTSDAPLTALPAEAWASTERATGIGRAAWLDFFGPRAELDHAALARDVLERLEAQRAAEPTGPLAERNLEWWAQSVTVLYEQHAGRREANQRCDGSFGASASKTVPGHPEEVARRWAEWARDNLPLPLDSEPRISSTEKWEYWRATSVAGAQISVNINSRRPGKTTLAAEVKKLNSAEESAEFKGLFKQVFADFAAWLGQLD